MRQSNEKEEPHSRDCLEEMETYVGVDVQPGVDEQIADVAW